MDTFRPPSALPLKLGDDLRQYDINDLLYRLRCVYKNRAKFFIVIRCGSLPPQERSKFMRILAIAVFATTSNTPPQNSFVGDYQREDFRK